METINVTWTGEQPGILMHSDQGLDPLHPVQKQVKAITSKGTKNRTEEDIEELMRLEFVLGLYHDKSVGPYIPASMVEAVIRDGAKARKLGKETTRSILVPMDKIALEYDGPRDVKALWKKRFYDTRSVKVGQSRVLRTRPHFRDWSINFDISYDAEHLDRDLLVWCMENAGARVGVGDFRPRFGRFGVKVS